MNTITSEQKNVLIRSKLERKVHVWLMYYYLKNHAFQNRHYFASYIVSLITDTSPHNQELNTIRNFLINTPTEHGFNELKTLCATLIYNAEVDMLEKLRIFFYEDDFFMHRYIIKQLKNVEMHLDHIDECLNTMSSPSTHTPVTDGTV